MASLYDILTVDDKQYYRMNKNILPKEKVPKDILKALTPTNVIDENGMVVVDEKAGPAQEPTEENLAEIKKASEPAKPSAGAEDASDENKTDESSDEDEDDSSTEDSEPDITEDDEADADDDEDEDSEPATKEPEPQAPAKPARAAAPKPVVPVFKSAVPQSRPGMGFPRVNGKTVDIFDGKTPHTHLKLIDGVTVPLSAESFRTRNDVEIRNKLKELGISTLNFSEIEAAQNADAATGRAGNADSLLLDESESDDDATEN